jgi:release factor glutamine methyltransferase
MPSWRELRAQVERDLAAAGVGSAEPESRWILEEVSGYEAGELLLAADELVPTRAVAQIDELMARRRAGEPLQYVLGSWSFRGLDLLVDPRVLIPRPETELTAQIAIDDLAARGERRGRADPWAATATTYVIADLGTGSGALALALASELPDALVWATDRSEAALAVARANLAGAGQPATRVRLGLGDWFDAIPDELRGGLRLVVTNPPYIAEHEVDALPREVRDHEPRSALVSGPTGLEAISEIVRQAPEWLEPDGSLVCELAPDQGEEALALARAAGFRDANVVRDLLDRDRVLRARR